MRPIALTLIAAALLYQGFEAILGMLGAFSEGTININLMAILLFAGVGLLRLGDTSTLPSARGCKKIP